MAAMLSTGKQVYICYLPAGKRSQMFELDGIVKQQYLKQQY